MKTSHFLQEHVGRLRTHMGAFFPGQKVIFRGHNLHTDLSGIDWIELYAFGITGRRFSPEQLQLMHALWVNTSYPDSRIWNNRIAALAGSARSTGNLGVSAALAVSEAHIYGRGNEVQAISFFLSTQEHLSSGRSLPDCIQQELQIFHRIAGYGRPLINADERIAPTMVLADTLNLADGPHVRLAFDVEQSLLNNGRDLRLNYGGLVSAFGADLGFSVSEFYAFMFPSFLAGMQPCYIDASSRAVGATFPLSCDSIAYEGPPKRRWHTCVSPNLDS